MRRLSRLQRSIDRLGHRSTPRSATSYLCSTCEVRAAFSTSSPVNADGSFTDKVRRRIWGTDQPPGAEDPYGGPSILEKVRGKNSTPASTAPKKEATPVDPNYEPADTWDGLEMVGGIQKGVDDIYAGFAPSDKVMDTSELTVALHRVIVETAALQQAGRPVSELGQAGVEWDITTGVQIVANAQGVSLDFSNSDTTLEEVLESLKPIESVEEIADEQFVDEVEAETVEAAAVTETVEPAAAELPEQEVELVDEDFDYQEVVASWNPSWLQLSLQDPEVKFHVLKRLSQLTGQRVKDSALRAIKTPQNVLNQITIRPKPKKLAELLAQHTELVSLPNVRIVSRRITPIDKEKEVGRWKVIEEALVKRGLPVTGTE